MQKWTIGLLGVALFFVGCASPAPVKNSTVMNEFPTGDKGGETVQMAETTLPEDPSILDYYLALPAETLDHFYPLGSEDTPEARQALIEVVDEENYYLKLKDNVQHGGMDTFAMAVFLQPDDTHLIALEGGMSTTLSFRDLGFFEIQNGEWMNVSEGKLPSGIDFEALRDEAALMGSQQFGLDYEGPYSFYYELPRYSTDLVLYEYTTGQEMLRLTWRKGQFELKSFDLWYLDYPSVTDVYPGHSFILTFPASWYGVEVNPDRPMCSEELYQEDTQGLAFCRLVGEYYSFFLNNNFFFQFITIPEDAVGDESIPTDEYTWVATYGGRAYYVSGEPWGELTATLKKDIPGILETMRFEEVRR